MPLFPTKTNITIDGYFNIFDQYKNDLNDNTIVIACSIFLKNPILITTKDCFIPGIGHMGKKSDLEELPEVVNIVNNF